MLGRQLMTVLITGSIGTATGFVGAQILSASEESIKERLAGLLSSEARAVNRECNLLIMTINARGTSKSDSSVSNIISSIEHRRNLLKKISAEFEMQHPRLDC